MFCNTDDNDDECMIMSVILTWQTPQQLQSVSYATIDVNVVRVACIASFRCVCDRSLFTVSLGLHVSYIVVHEC